MQLFMLKIGATLPGRLIEQHDVLFGIAAQASDLAATIDTAWPEAAGRWHIDCWRAVTRVDGHRITVMPHTQAQDTGLKLFFINLGGYRRDDFEEYHHKMLLVAPDMAAAVRRAKESAFYRDFDFPGAVSHIDDQFTVDMDDIHIVGDVLTAADGAPYALYIEPEADGSEDTLHIGYISRKKFTP